MLDRAGGGDERLGGRLPRRPGRQRRAKLLAGLDDLGVRQPDVVHLADLVGREAGGADALAHGAGLRDLGRGGRRVGPGGVDRQRSGAQLGAGVAHVVAEVEPGAADAARLQARPRVVAGGDRALVALGVHALG